MKKVLRIALGTTIAPLAAVALTACGMFEEAGPTGITLADAGEVLNVIDALPPRFSRLDPDLPDYSAEDLGVPSDASVVETFQSAQPFQRVFSFLRVADDDNRRRQIGMTLFDEDNMRNVMSYYMEAVADQVGATELGEQITFSYPEVAAGGALAEAELTTDEFILHFELLRFRSQDSRVFVYVNSFYIGDDHEPTVSIAREIEQRIADFDSRQTESGDKSGAR